MSLSCKTACVIFVAGTVAQQAMVIVGYMRFATELSFLPAISASARQQEAGIAQQLLPLGGVSVRKCSENLCL